MTVQTPHGYDGIGQALRAAFRDHCEPPEPLVLAIQKLETIN